MADLFAGRYELEERLGVGGMSTVQRAFDTRLERHVAVKLLAEHLAADQAFVARFRREALAAARLVHPNVVQVYDFGSDEASGRQFIVMEHVAGQSCAEILRDVKAEGRTVEPERAVDILAQSCRGLDYAHRNGVIHRDVKPGNLLLNRDEQVKLADFGIAKAVDDSDITKVGSVVGTAAYLAPEQARGEAAGPASDLYALGVVAYQLLGGRLPYEGSSLTELARQQELGPPERLDRVNPDVPSALAEAVQRALASQPEARYAGALEMESALRDGLRGVAPASIPGGWDAGEDSTRALDPTAATSAMARTSVGAPPPRRGLEPIDEEPRRRPPARREPAPAPARRRNRGLARLLAFLLVLAVAGAIGYAAYDSASETKRVQLRENVEGGFDRAIDELRGVIEDNTR